MLNIFLVTIFWILFLGFIGISENAFAFDLTINEINADPILGLDGDSNGDGVTSSIQDEFIEIVNTSGRILDISFYEIYDSESLRHVFPPKTLLFDGQAIVIFGGGSPTGEFGSSLVQIASTGSLALNNYGDTVSICSHGLCPYSPDDSYTYGIEGGNNESLTKYPDITGTFVPHSVASSSGGSLYSPGTKIDGSQFNFIVIDNDGDGYSAIQDCSDDNPDIFPGAPEIPNGLDNDCDGIDSPYNRCTLLDFEEYSEASTIGIVRGAEFIGNAQVLTDSDLGGFGLFANEPSPSQVLKLIDPDYFEIKFEVDVSEFKWHYSERIPDVGYLKFYDENNILIDTIDLSGFEQTLDGDPTGVFTTWISGSYDAGEDIINRVEFIAPENSRIYFDDIQFCQLNPPETSILMVSSSEREIFSFNYLSGLQEPTFLKGHPDNSVSPRALEYGPGDVLFVADQNSLSPNGILRFDGSSGVFLDVFYSEAIETLVPFDLTFGPDGHLYVLNDRRFQENREVIEIDENGNFVGIFTVLPGKLFFDIKFGPDGNLYTSDRANNSIISYQGPYGSNPGSYIDTIIPGLDNLDGFTFGPNGEIFVSGRDDVASPTASKILKLQGPLDPNPGDLVEVFIERESGRFQNFAFGPNGNVYAQNGYYTTTILQFDGLTGDFIEQTVSDTGIGNSQFDFGFTRFSLFDFDGDKIPDSNDPRPSKYSNFFNYLAVDSSIVKGKILSRGDQFLTLEPLSSGIKITAANNYGNMPAVIGDCIGTQTTLTPRDSEILNCASSVIQVIQGPIDVKFFEGDELFATATLDTGDDVTFDDDSLDITNNNEFDPVDVLVGGQLVTILPGDTFSVNEPPNAQANGPYLAAINTSTPVYSTGSSDPDGDELTYSWSASNCTIDDTDPQNQLITCSRSGIFEVTLEVEDPFGETDDDSTSIIVYDPDGGFVTGGGWIDSPEGADYQNPSSTGKANFGFVSKYKKGADIPEGITEFVFKAGDLNFHSSEYQWLVVSGPKAMFKGTGTINGSGNYGFIVSAIDENLTESTDADLFRIKIWEVAEEDIPRYDNQKGYDEDADPTTQIGGGSIVIHNVKGNTQEFSESTRVASSSNSG